MMLLKNKHVTSSSLNTWRAQKLHLLQLHVCSLCSHLNVWYFHINPSFAWISCWWTSLRLWHHPSRVRSDCSSPVLHGVSGSSQECCTTARRSLLSCSFRVSLISPTWLSLPLQLLPLQQPGSATRLLPVEREFFLPTVLAHRASLFNPSGSLVLHSSEGVYLSPDWLLQVF